MSRLVSRIAANMAYSDGWTPAQWELATTPEAMPYYRHARAAIGTVSRIFTHLEAVDGVEPTPWHEVSEGVASPKKEDIASAERISPSTVTVKEACRLLSIGNTKIYALFAEGRIETLKVGRKTLVTVASIERFIAAGLRQKSDQYARQGNSASRI